MFNADICNVTQLLPLDAMEDLYIHHLSNKNNKQTPWKVLTTTDLHKRQMGKLMRMDANKKLWLDRNGKYNGVKMFLDEKNQTASISFDLSAYDAYIQRGAMLAKEELKEWE